MFWVDSLTLWDYFSSQLRYWIPGAEDWKTGKVDVYRVTTHITACVCKFVSVHLEQRITWPIFFSVQICTRVLFYSLDILRACSFLWIICWDVGGLGWFIRFEFYFKFLCYFSPYREETRTKTLIHKLSCPLRNSHCFCLDRNPVLTSDLFLKFEYSFSMLNTCFPVSCSPSCPRPSGFKMPTTDGWKKRINYTLKRSHLQTCCHRLLKGKTVLLLWSSGSSIILWALQPVMMSQRALFRSQTEGLHHLYQFVAMACSVA